MATTTGNTTTNEGRYDRARALLASRPPARRSTHALARPRKAPSKPPVAARARPRRTRRARPPRPTPPPPRRRRRRAATSPSAPRSSTSAPCWRRVTASPAPPTDVADDARRPVAGSTPAAPRAPWPDGDPQGATRAERLIRRGERRFERETNAVERERQPPQQRRDRSQVSTGVGSASRRPSRPASPRASASSPTSRSSWRSGNGLPPGRPRRGPDSGKGCRPHISPAEKYLSSLNRRGAASGRPVGL